MDLPSIISGGEGQRTEFKTSFSTENEIIDSLGAFANSEGGTVLVGVKDDGTVVGAQIGINTLENIANQLVANSDPRILVSIETTLFDDKKVVSISVGPPRPGGLFYTFGRPLVRVGKTNQTMSPQEQQARLLEGHVDLPDVIAAKLGIDYRIYEHGDSSGRAYGIKVSSGLTGVQDCTGKIEDLMLLTTLEGLDGTLRKYPRGYLQWAQHSRINDDPIRTTVDSAGAYLDLILQRAIGYRLSDGSQSKFHFAFAQHESRASNAPPSGHAILLLISVQGAAVIPIYAVVQFNPNWVVEFIHTGEFNEDGSENIRVTAEDNLQVRDICDERPNLTDYQIPVVIEDSPKPEAE